MNFPAHEPPTWRRPAAIGAAVVVCLATAGAAMGVVPGVQSETPEPPGSSPSAVQAFSPQLSEGPTGDDSGDGAVWRQGVSVVLAAERLGRAPSGLVQAAGQVPGDDLSLPQKTGNGKRIVFSESRQRVWLVNRRNKVVETYLVSGSIHDNLDPGRYRVYSKSREAVAFNYRETMNFMVRFTQGDNAAIGFHDIPKLKNGKRVQTRRELGTPLSAGCIRQARPNAKALWDFSEVGTRVTVVA